MAELLTPWEMALVAMTIRDYRQLNPCECEVLCICEKKEEPCSQS
jgi:hypothetical protein